jgi:soluble lytic murein transglycosylase
MAKTQVPDLLSSSERDYYAQVFGAIRGQNWAKASELLDGRDKGVLHDIARAELFLAANSPRVEMGPLLSLLNAAPDLPHAERLAILATKRGATILPDRPQMVRMANFGGLTRRGKPRSVADGTVPPTLAATIQERIVADDPAGAAAALAEQVDFLSPQARTELQQRVAWSYYLENRDQEALDMARAATRVRANGSARRTGPPGWPRGAWAIAPPRCRASKAPPPMPGTRSSAPPAITGPRARRRAAVAPIWSRPICARPANMARRSMGFLRPSSWAWPTARSARPISATMTGRR